VKEALGAPLDKSVAERVGRPGVATGLAWTPAGGQLMFIEASQMPGKGQLHMTGKIGDVMKESVAAAMTYLRARPEQLGLPFDFLDRIDVHLHLPGGGFPKDGPSAGIPIFVALSSMLTKLKVRPDVGMTGEITLRGAVLPVTGIKEKALAAHRAGLTHIILPKRNEPDVEEVPEVIRKGLTFHYVNKVDEILAFALDLESGPSGRSSERPAAPPPS
jgi:ATP-dependent Lon protease